jgi:hypothetical protein
MDFFKTVTLVCITVATSFFCYFMYCLSDTTENLKELLGNSNEIIDNSNKPTLRKLISNGNELIVKGNELINKTDTLIDEAEKPAKQLFGIIDRVDRNGIAGFGLQLIAPYQPAVKSCSSSGQLGTNQQNDGQSPVIGNKRGENGN